MNTLTINTHRLLAVVLLAVCLAGAAGCGTATATSPGPFSTVIAGEIDLASPGDIVRVQEFLAGSGVSGTIELHWVRIPIPTQFMDQPETIDVYVGPVDGETNGMEGFLPGEKVMRRLETMPQSAPYGFQLPSFYTRDAVLIPYKWVLTEGDGAPVTGTLTDGRYRIVVHRL